MGPLPAAARRSLLAALAHDPRPSYQADSDRVYGMDFADWNVKFTVSGGVLRVESITPIAD